MKRLISAAALAAICAATPALANHENRNGGFDERAARIEQRIEHARQTGELTPPEYQRLRDELRSVRRAERHYVSDGWLSGQERQALDVRLDRLALHVRHEQRDGERVDGFYNYGQSANGRY
jgi:hypothetical protein